MGTTKSCFVCGLDVSGQKRVKDAWGRYYCHPCYRASAQDANPSPDVAADSYAITEPGYSPHTESGGEDHLLALAAATAGNASPLQRVASTHRRSGGTDLKLLAKILVGCGIVIALGIGVAVMSWHGNGRAQAREEDDRAIRTRSQDKFHEKDEAKIAAAAATQKQLEDEARQSTAAAEATAKNIRDSEEANRRSAALIQAQMDQERMDDAREPKDIADAGKGFAYGEVKFTERNRYQNGLECSLKVVNRTGRDVSTVFVDVHLYTASGEIRSFGTTVASYLHTGQTKTCRFTIGVGDSRVKLTEFARYEVSVDVIYRDKFMAWDDDK